MLTRLVHGWGGSESGLAIDTRQSREHCEQINLGGAFRRNYEGICRAKMSKRKRRQYFRVPKTKAVNLRMAGSWISLNPRFADVRAMWPQPRWNATLVPGMRCNDRNHLRFSYGGMFLGPVCARSRPRGEESERSINRCEFRSIVENSIERDDSLPNKS